jgi:hypothetical protein
MDYKKWIHLKKTKIVDKLIEINIFAISIDKLIFY